MSNSDLDLIPENYKSISISDNEIVLPYKETIEVINHLYKEKVSVFAWEGWAFYNSNKKAHFNDFQGIENILRYAGETWSEYLEKSNSLCKESIDKSYNNWKINYPLNPELYFCLSIQTKKESLGFAIDIGEQLTYIEEMLLEDLKYYGINSEKFIACWDMVCPEGKYTEIDNSKIHNFSGLYFYNNDYQLEGWIDFIHEDDFFIIYWDILDIKINNTVINKKKNFGIPEHIWEKIHDNLKSKYINDKMKNNILPLP